MFVADKTYGDVGDERFVAGATFLAMLEMNFPGRCNIFGDVGDELFVGAACGDVLA